VGEIKFETDGGRIMMMTCQSCGKECERTGYRQKRCRACAKERKLGQMREYQRQWRIANPKEAREKGREKNRLYRARHLQKERERDRRYQAAKRAVNPKPNRERARQWYAANRERVRQRRREQVIAYHVLHSPRW
jgi:hypothetical protein